MCDPQQIYLRIKVYVHLAINREKHFELLRTCVVKMEYFEHIACVARVGHFYYTELLVGRLWTVVYRAIRKTHRNGLISIKQ